MEEKSVDTLIETFHGGAIQTTDVISVVSSADHTNGWRGGLDTISSILSKVRNPFSSKLRELGIHDNLKLSGVSGQILTGHGLVGFSRDDASVAFGGDPRTQMIGLTLCALAHECGGQTAYHLFVDCLLPTLFDGTVELTDGIATQLSSNALLTRILNEGATRGLTKRFCSAIRALDLPAANPTWPQDGARIRSPDGFRASEIQFVGGLLKWIGHKSRTPYKTRSGLTARVAACLKAVGFPIGSITSWDGQGRPSVPDHKSVLLVIGGTSSTDPMALGVEEIPTDPLLYVRHYNLKTVGALLTTAFHHQFDVFPETFQQIFYETNTWFTRNIGLLIESEKEKQRLILRPVWPSPNKTHSSSIARRLAALYFPFNADRIARFYDQIATAEHLEVALSSHSAREEDGNCPIELIWFRATTAAIVLSMAFQLMDPESRERMHSTNLFLGNPDWLLSTCKILDRGYYHGLDYYKAVLILAIIHTAFNPNRELPDDQRIIGWRSNTYSVIPSLFKEMTPSQDIGRLHCMDIFLSNIKTYDDGSIKDSTPVVLFRMENALPQGDDDEDASSALQSIASPWIGNPNIGHADAQLYLAFESPRHYASIDMCLAARIKGNLIGTVSILDVIGAICESHNETVQCQGCEEHVEVFNVKSSVWAINTRYKPLASGLPTFVPIRGDHAWALFLAGQAKFFDGRLCFSCVNCSIRSRNSKGGLFMGYL